MLKGLRDEEDEAEITEARGTAIGRAEDGVSARRHRALDGATYHLSFLHEKNHN